MKVEERVVTSRVVVLDEEDINILRRHANMGSSPRDLKDKGLTATADTVRWVWGMIAQFDKGLTD